jgi:ABC-2 type transport system ATP-binding protein
MMADNGGVAPGDVTPPGRPVADGAIIRAQGLTKEFGDRTVVEDLTFEVPRGAIFGYIGPSGSGKTTTLRMLTGVYEPTRGKATVLGRQPTRFTQSTREKIGYMPQLFVLYPELTVWENLNFAASIYGMGLRRGKRLQELLDFVELGEHRNKLARDISGGMQRRLSLAATLVHDPELIFLDEPTAGIDPVLRRKFWDHFKQLQQEGRTLFITTQYVGETVYCDLVGVMGQGRLAMIDTPDRLRERAMGGDMVDIQTSQRLPWEPYLRELGQLPFVRSDVQRLDEAGGGLRLTVDEAATAIPALVEWFQAHNVEMVSIQQYLPPFDDVFVQLMKKEADVAA